MKFNRKLPVTQRPQRSKKTHQSARNRATSPIVFYSMDELIYRLVWRITSQTLGIITLCLFMWPFAEHPPEHLDATTMPEFYNESSLTSSLSDELF